MLIAKIQKNVLKIHCKPCCSWNVLNFLTFQASCSYKLFSNNKQRVDNLLSNIMPNFYKCLNRIPILYLRWNKKSIVTIWMYFTAYYSASVKTSSDFLGNSINCKQGLLYVRRETWKFRIESFAILSIWLNKIQEIRFRD